MRTMSCFKSVVVVFVVVDVAVVFVVVVDVEITNTENVTRFKSSKNDLK